MDQIDLSGGWDRTWQALSSPFEPWLAPMLTSIAVILVLVAVGKYVWERRRGSGGAGVMGGNSGVSNLGNQLIAPALLAAPTLVFPIALTIADSFINAIVSIARSAGL